MFAFKFNCFAVVLTAVILTATAFAAPSADLAPGRMAVTLNLSITGETDRSLVSGLRQCLISHLEYYFWKKGWEAEIVDSDTLSTLPESDRELNNAGFKYSAEIGGKITCRRFGTPLLDDCLQWPFPDFEISSHLRLTIRDLCGGGLIYSGKPVTMSSLKRWLFFDGVNIERQPRELPNFVFMRQIEQMMSELPLCHYQNEPAAKALEVEIYAEEFDSDLELAFDYASRIFHRDFGLELKILNKSKIGLTPGPLDRLEDVFREGRNILSSKNGPMRVIIYRITDPDKVFISRDRIQVGLADVGYRLAVVTALEMPGEDYNSFRAMQIGQLLVHEISHLCGAVDVADDNSIMCGYSSWVSSGHFDPLNRRIVSEVGLHGGRPGPIADYLAFIAEGLERGDYTLVDFPHMYFQFQNLNEPGIISEACRVGQFGRALPYAVKGFQDYILKNYESSRDNFYKCLALLENNGAVHYYLSLVTTGALADFHARKSAEAGFYPARVGYNAAIRQAFR